MMHVAFITGSYPPDTCGIGDYTGMLVAALEEQGVRTELVYGMDWRLRNVSTVIRHIRSLAPDIVHLQYPTAGFGWHLTPQVLGVVQRPVVTIHEISQARIARKLSLVPFLAAARHVVFTTTGEREYARRYAPWIVRKSSVIPIGSNVSIGKESAARTPYEIVYFGMLRPNKGLEEVIKVASLIKNRRLPYRIRLVGRPFPPGSDYFKGILRQCRDLPVEMSIGQPDEHVVDILARAAVGYMPFPDGASGRRGSLLALLANGVATVTTQGEQTPADLAECVLFAHSPEQALDHIAALSEDPVRRERLSLAGRSYAEQFSWKTIARLHIDLYERLVKTAPVSR